MLVCPGKYAHFKLKGGLNKRGKAVKGRHKQARVADACLWGFYSCHIALMKCRDPSVL